MNDLFQPFAPEPTEARPRLFKPVPFRVIAPNLITLLALCLGLTAIRLAYEGRLEPAIIAIMVAAVLDGVDGRVARLLKGTSRFGAELDSLADFLNFGVAPALVLHCFVLHEVKAGGWVVALIFAIAAALRLARFNAALDDPHQPEWKKDFFVGMPAPAGAGTALLPIYLHFLGVPVTSAAPVALVYVLVIALHDGLDGPDLLGEDLGQAHPARLGAAALRADGRGLRPSRQLPLRGHGARRASPISATVPLSVAALPGDAAPETARRVRSLNRRSRGRAPSTSAGRPAEQQPDIR